MYPQLFDHVSDVIACGDRADAEFRGDLSIRQTASQQAQHFVFPPRQRWAWPHVRMLTWGHWFR